MMRWLWFLSVGFVIVFHSLGCSAEPGTAEKVGVEKPSEEKPNTSLGERNDSGEREDVAGVEPSDSIEPSAEVEAEPEAIADSGPERGPEAVSEAGPESRVEVVPESQLPQPPRKLCWPRDGSIDVGTRLGNYIQNAQLFDCDGNPVSLHDFCGAKAIWLSLHHAWCPHCRKLRDIIEGLQSDYEIDGLVAVSIVVQSSSRTAPTQSTCRSWRKDGKQIKSFTLYDPTWVTRAFWEQNYTALNVFVNGKNIISGKVHTDTESQLKAQIEKALGR